MATDFVRWCERQPQSISAPPRPLKLCLNVKLILTSVKQLKAPKLSESIAFGAHRLDC